MNGNLRGIVAIALLAAGCGSGGGDGGTGGGTGGNGEQVDQGVGGNAGGEGGQLIGGDTGGSIGGSGGSVGGSGGSVGGSGGSVGGSGGSVGGSGGDVGGAGGEGGSGGAGGGVVPPVGCEAISLNDGAAGDGTYSVSGSTADGVNAFAGTCGGDEAADAIYGFAAPEAGTWVFTTRVGEDVEAFDTVVYALSDCESAESELDCNDDSGSTQSAVAVALEAGQGVYVVVDGFRENAGPYTLTALRQQTLAIGDVCERGDIAAACPEASLCVDVDGDDTLTCTEVVTIPVGGECEPFSDVGHCEEGLSCEDPETDGTFNCLEPIISAEGGPCDTFGGFMSCAEGLICADPEFTGTGVCTVPVILEAGAVCDRNNQAESCAEGLRCVDADDDGVTNCTAPIAIPDGGECEPFSEFAFCTEPAQCVDPDDDGAYTCVAPRIVEVGGACVPGDELVVCIEGSACADVDGDGTLACAIPGADVAACPAAWAPVALLDTAAAAPWSVEVDTSADANRTAGSCGGRNAPESIVEFVAPADGDYVAHTVAGFDTVLYARNYCTFSEPQLDCNDDHFELENANSQITVTLVAGEHTFFFLDGYDGDAAGPATLVVEPAPAPIQ